MQSSPPNLETESRSPQLPFWWVLAANALVVVSTIQFFFLPRGAGTRPMSWGMLVFMLAAAGLAGIVLGMRKCYERMPYQWLVIVLGFSPLPLAFIMFHLALCLCGFVVEELLPKQQSG